MSLPAQPQITVTLNADANLAPATVDALFQAAGAAADVMRELDQVVDAVIPIMPLQPPDEMMVEELRIRDLRAAIAAKRRDAIIVIAAYTGEHVLQWIGPFDTAQQARDYGVLHCRGFETRETRHGTPSWFVNVLTQAAAQTIYLHSPEGRLPRAMPDALAVAAAAFKAAQTMLRRAAADTLGDDTFMAGR